MGTVDRNNLEFLRWFKNAVSRHDAIQNIMIWKSRKEEAIQKWFTHKGIISPYGITQESKCSTERDKTLQLIRWLIKKCVLPKDYLEPSFVLSCSAHFIRKTKSSFLMTFILFRWVIFLRMKIEKWQRMNSSILQPLWYLQLSSLMLWILNEISLHPLFTGFNFDSLLINSNFSIQKVSKASRKRYQQYSQERGCI